MCATMATCLTLLTRRKGALLSHLLLIVLFASGDCVKNTYRNPIRTSKRSDDGETVIPPQVFVTYEGDDIMRNELEEELPCKDLREDCAVWAADKRCDEDPVWMHPHCPVSCGVCEFRRKVVDSSEAFSPAIMIADQIQDAVGASLGVPQLIVEEDSKEMMMMVLGRIEEARHYIENVVMEQDRYELVRDDCRNYEPLCAWWAVSGECEKNEDFMNENCAPVCFTCEYLHIEALCPIDKNEKHGTSISFWFNFASVEHYI